MAWSSEETARVQAIETKINEMQVAINKLASRAQLKQLLNIRQSEIQELQQDVTDLQSQVEALQAFHQ